MRKEYVFAIWLIIYDFTSRWESFLWIRLYVLQVWIHILEFEAWAHKDHPTNLSLLDKLLIEIHNRNQSPRPTHLAICICWNKSCAMGIIYRSSYISSQVRIYKDFLAKESTKATNEDKICEDNLPKSQTSIDLYFDYSSMNFHN